MFMSLFIYSARIYVALPYTRHRSEPCCCCLVAKLCPVLLLGPMDYRLPVSSVREIFQATVLESVVISFSRGSPRSRDRTCVSCIGRQILYHWATQGARFKILSASNKTYVIIKGVGLSLKVLRLERLGSLLIPVCCLSPSMSFGQVVTSVWISLGLGNSLPPGCWF